MSTAILVDAGFFIKKHKKFTDTNHEPIEAAKNLHEICLRHLQNGATRKNLYRIFVYDCPPLTKKAHNPVTLKCEDFGKSQVAQFRNIFHDELKKKRKVALRLGHLIDSAHWTLKPPLLNKLLKNEISIDDLQGEDVYYDVVQKGVDMKIGLDIASLAYKKLVDQIILISGDSDFVPAAKLARIEGIDFILDPLWASIRPELHEHIDGLKSVTGKDRFNKKTM